MQFWGPVWFFTDLCWICQSSSCPLNSHKPLRNLHTCNPVVFKWRELAHFMICFCYLHKKKCIKMSKQPFIPALWDPSLKWAFEWKFSKGSAMYFFLFLLMKGMTLISLIRREKCSVWNCCHLQMLVKMLDIRLFPFPFRHALQNHL